MKKKYRRCETWEMSFSHDDNSTVKIESLINKKQSERYKIMILEFVTSIEYTRH